MYKLMIYKPNYAALSGLFIFLACSSGLTIKNATANETLPWSDKALAEPTDASQLSGKLGKDELEKLIAKGQSLFSAAYTIEDGVGRPMATQAIIPTKRRRPPKNAFSRTAGMDANACSSCHNQPAVGGAGDFVANVFVSEGFQLADFDSTDPQFSNERNTNHLFGAGLVELLAREMSSDLATQRNNGLLQARASGEPVTVKLASTDDFDEDSVEQEISSADVSSMVLWQASLKPPVVKTQLPQNWIDAAARGSNRFDELNCNACHRRNLPLESLVFHDPGPLDAAGTLRSNEQGARGNAAYDLALMEWSGTLKKDNQGRWLIPLFGDLKRHVIADTQVDTLGNELLSQRFVERNVIMTSELWGIASTAPYGHRGDQTTLNEIIAAHGGAARKSRDAWTKLDASAKSDITAFLKTLIIEP